MHAEGDAESREIGKPLDRAGDPRHLPPHPLGLLLSGGVLYHDR
jgi:hypothetical protein